MQRKQPSDLHGLAASAGLQRSWRDVEGNELTVSDDALKSILDAMGFASGSASSIKRSHASIAAQQGELPKLVVTEVGAGTPLPTDATKAELTDEQGVTFVLPIDAGVLTAPSEPGYYDLVFAEGSCRLAVAPRQCPLPQTHAGRLWGASLQIPSLRRQTDVAFGALGELDIAVQSLAARGCQAVAINPIHALFPGVGEDFSPYSPSSRTYLNAAIASPELLGMPPLTRSRGEALIDWPSALPEQLQVLRENFTCLTRQQRDRIAKADDGEPQGLYRHALHDALFCYFRARGAADWRSWPSLYRKPGNSAVKRFAAENADEIAFHLYAQWLAREGLAAVQCHAREAGMAIGLIADLAIGVRPGGSDCWSMPKAMLSGLTIGAPPDSLGPLGQNWSITGFSPHGLRAAGYQPWIDMLRSALRSAGGLRIDHAFGLARLWVIPDGGECADGAYLTYPFFDLVRLVTLEAHRANALIIAEDLGTAPHGFTHAVSERNMLGMRVLWFERAADHGFIGAQEYPENCVAMTGTHDTATVAGWWRGRDLDWADKLGRLPPDVDRQKAEEIRDWDRGLLWSTIGTGERPAPDNPEPVVHAALDHIGRSPALLALSPVEDLLGEAEQPNLPGTTREHPNWRSRLAGPLEDLLSEAIVVDRINAIARGRQ